ncbi:conserved Plasmodium protein, unknown function [Plasmodium gallinaceum]|uniref:Uncharacterized protein n=1 Tax=Plasmodium gallinaceum TaxID=5849 RepID=A0A1J1GUN4_PLAGA|nr:conserved Plasmodium protein, unknown function [Plasmodium gallinaceum]CRG96189.1 conserved Plasmodium protein, unknown function [Plasmodium gallinaceum]
MDIKESLNKNSQKKVLHKKNINDLYNEKKKASENENEDNKERKTITNKSIIFFQIFIFIIYFLVLLIGSFNFSFKLFQVREKHLYEFLNNREELFCKSYLKEKDNNKKILYKNTNNLIDNNDTFPYVNFKYYFTRAKYNIKEENKINKNKRQIKIFICLNKKKNFDYSDFYNIFSSFKKYVTKFLSFSYNEIKNAFFRKNNNNYINKVMKYYAKNDLIGNKYLHYNFLLNSNDSYKNYYVNIETLFYLYLYDICYLHDFNYVKNQTYNLSKSYMVFDKMNEKLHIENKKDITLLINHVDKYLNDEILVNLLDKLYLDICKRENLINYLKNKNDKKEETDRHNGSNLKSDIKNSKLAYNYNNENTLKDTNYNEYYILYNKIESMRNINKYNTFISRLRKKIKTINSLKSLNMCLKEYIINLKKVPLYFFLNIFYDTPCYVYNKPISNLLRNYYKGIFLYFVIFIGCIHVVFSPFPITLVHFRRFFIYFLIIMYRLFILYFIPSIIQYIIYKFHYFKEEYIHIFDYSDHVILFSTLLFIISLESKAIQYTINHQKQSFDYFHYKYNRKLCFFFLKLILYYYYILIFFFLYTSYFTSKYFHTTNEIFVAYFFSTFSIFFFFYFFLYKNYFSFYTIGITSYIKNNSITTMNVLHSAPYLANAYNSLKDKFAFD